jgi:dTDP-4-amino-4,6-dideoxygalactose transaminase
MLPTAPWPHFTSDEIAAVTAVLASGKVNYWTGNRSREFERLFAQWTGSRHAIALGNGTLALDLALNALGIGPGDEVIVSPRSFIASVSTVVNCGATPVFADIHLDSGNIEAETIAAVLTERTKAILPVHLGGWPCDMPAIQTLARDRNLYIVEDCAQAHGARIDGRGVGTFCDVGAWSFCQDKIMTTGGEGGMVTTDDPDLWSRMWSFKDHGKSWEAVYERSHPPGFRWLHESFGTNWRMMEFQAALGIIQLERMEAWHRRRTEIAEKIRAALAPLAAGIRCPQPREGLVHAYYRQYAYVRPGGLREGWDRDGIIAAAQQSGVTLLQGSCSEIYLEKAFDGTPWRPAARLPHARELGETSIAFLTHPTIEDEELEIMLDRMTGILSSAIR